MCRHISGGTFRVILKDRVKGVRGTSNGKGLIFNKIKEQTVSKIDRLK